jgi:hypothetical protein
VPSILLPRSPEEAAGLAALGALGILAGLLGGLVWAWRGGTRTRLLATFVPAARENAVRHLLPLAEGALRAGRLLARARDPLEAETAALDPGFAELLRLVHGMRGLTAVGGALWLTGARAEVAVTRLWAVLESALGERLGAGDLGDLVGAAAGEEAGLERVRPRLRRWLRGDPGPEAELWLLAAFGTVLGAEIRRLGEGRVRAPRRELRALRERLGQVPPGLPDGEALAEALGDYLNSSSSTPRT